MMQNHNNGYSMMIVNDLMAFSDRSALEHFVQSSRYTHYLQSPQWLDTCISEDYFYIVSYKNDEIVAASLIRRHKLKLLRRSKYFIDRGPVFNDAKALDRHLVHVLAVLSGDGLWVRMNPYILPFDKTLSDILDRHHLQENKYDHASYHATVLIDLRRGEEEIKSDFRRSLRTQLNKASRLDIRVVPCESESEFEIFLHKLNAFRQTRNLAPIMHDHGLGIFGRMLNGASKGVLLLAYYEREIVAGIGLFSSGQYLIYEWGYSSEREDHRKLPLSHILHWEGICWAKSRNYYYYDFGGYWLEKGESDSINRFKSGFSTRVERIMLPRQINLSPMLTPVANVLGRVKQWMLPS